MTKTYTVWLLVLLLGVNVACAQEPPPEKRTGFLDAIYGTLFGTSSKPAASNPTEHEHAADTEAVAEVMDENMQEGIVDDDSPKEDRPPDRRIEVVSDFDEALKLSQLEQRPLLLIAGAEWCTWCRKLEKELASEDAEPILKKWIVVKIDVDAQPALAEEFEASALPALRILSADRRIAAKREGYLPLAELQEWLDAAAPQVDPSLTRVLYDSGVPNEEQLVKLVEFLGNRSPELRQSASRRLSDARAVSDQRVVEVLKAGKLAQKLCAIDILRSWGAPVDGLDPWQPETLAGTQIDELKSWIENHPATATADEPAEDKPADPAKIKDAVTRLLLLPEANSRSLMSEITSYGKAILPELRARLEDSEALNDQQRTRLRHVLMQALASEKTRGLHANLLMALASPQQDTHRQAAGRVLEIVSPADKSLIDELAGDSDPLVRELSIPALQRVGQLQQPERLQKFLADKSPSVRTAVLREIAKAPKPEAIKVLSQHARNETDEDLLVYTAKALGELLGHTGVDRTICRLTENESWRVRAAALDALGHFGNDHNDFTSTKLAKPVIAAILKAAEDTDSFVKQRALELLPKLFWDGNEREIVGFLVRRPENIESFWTAHPEYTRNKIGQRLTSAATELLEGDDPIAVTNAVKLLATMNPEGLREDLPKLLSSSHASIRIATLKATVAYVSALRQPQLFALANQPELISNSVEREPWYVVPKSLQSLPNPSALAMALENTDSEPEPIPADIAVSTDDPAMEIFVEPTSENVGAELESMELAPMEEESVVAKLLQAAPQMVEQLFGTVEVDPDFAEGMSFANNSNSEPIEAKPLSKWLTDWCAAYESRSGSEELETLRSQLRDAWDKSDPTALLGHDAQSIEQVERAWLAMANLALGRKELADKFTTPPFLTMLDAHAGLEPLSMPVPSQILPWLPSEQVVKCLQEMHLPLDTDLSSDMKVLLESVTMFENVKVASWLLDCVESRELTPAQFCAVSDNLARALRGEHNRAIRMSINANQLNGEAPFKSYVHKTVGYEAALEWLYDQKERELSYTQRALLLVQLFNFDYRLGTQSAVGCVAAAKKWDREVEVATVIALSAEASIAVDRAAQWLEHPLREVRVTAIKRLAGPSSRFTEAAWACGIGLTYGKNFEVPLFLLTERPLPVDQLKPLTEKEDADEAWPAYMLLLASGEEKDVDWKEDELDSDQLLTAMAALAKAGRVDEDAIKIYQRAAEQVGYFQQDLLKAILSGLKSEAVKKIVEGLRTETRFASPPF